MTPDEKRDRREARHDLQRQFRKIVNRHIGHYMTVSQVNAGARTLADRYLKEVVSPAAEQIEDQVIAEAIGRKESRG